MGKIDLTRPPYYDLFDPDKKYTKILGYPARVEQSREFTEAQSLAQRQLRNLGDTLYKDGQVLQGCLLTVSETSVAISSGKVYAEGQIVTFSEQSIVPIVGTGTEVIGIVVHEEIIDEVQDPTLKDPAEGYDNYLQPGCHRLKSTWTWEVIAGEGYGVFTLTDGTLRAEDLPNPKPMTITETTLDILARRDYEKSGNFLISGMSTKILPHPTDKWNKKHVIIGSGIARILGYDVYLQSDWVDDFVLARETDEILDEPHGQYDPIYAQYDYATDTGGAFILGERPVADVSALSAVFLDTKQMTKGGPPGGGGQDRIIDALLEIVHVVMGPSTVWDAETERFTGFTAEYTPTIDYVQRGNYIDWSPTGAEPAQGETYHIAFKYIHQCTKEIVEMTQVEDEALHHGNSTGNDVLAHPFVCETNDYTEVEMEVKKGSTTYVRDTDFAITPMGKIDWFDYEIQIKEIQRGGSPNTTDALSFSGGWELAQILDAAFYASLANASFNYTTNQFVANGDGGFIDYDLTSDYFSTVGVNSIDWSPSGAEPPAGGGSPNYVVAVLARKYKTSNHPTIGDDYTATYYYWNRKVNGDYLCRDSFYRTWVGDGDLGNEKQIYGLDLRDTINFWRSYNYGYDYNTHEFDFNMRKPYPGEEILATYTYYLPRYAHVLVDKDDGPSVRFGVSSRNPSEPVYDREETSLTLARVFCPADSLDVLVTEFGVRTLKMEDLNVMRDRVAQTEQNLASTWLDLDAKAFPITNKKGVVTTSFANNDRIDKGWPGSKYSIDPAWEQLTLPHDDSFYSLEYEPTASTCMSYDRMLSIEPNGTEIITQNFWTKDESISPYALAGQDLLSKAQSTYLVIKPHGDTVIIPRSVSFSSEADADAWANSDIAKLSNPTQWFSKGWTGGTEQRAVVGAGSGDNHLTTASSNQKETMVSEYMRDVLGNCRQLEITWEIPGGLFPTSALEMDFFLYFGGRVVTPTLTNGTPPGSASGSFRPRTLDNGASGTFMIPANVPEGRIEVKAESSPVNYNGKIFKQAVIAIYDAAVVEKLTMTFERCRCNCWCNCVCNCWNCRGRCGTGPLAETLEPVGKQRVLKSITGYFTKMHPTYGTFGCVVKTDNGVPTSNTIADSMIGRKFMAAADMQASRGEVEYIFDDPIPLLDDTYALVVTGEDAFNLNSIAEIAQGHDIRMKIAEMGKPDLKTGEVVGSQPFKNGILFKSLTGVTWEQDQTADLTFKAAFYTYPTGLFHIAYLGGLDVSETTAFILNWDAQIPEGTNIVFEYRTQATTWEEFQPYQMTYLTTVADRLEFRAKMSTTVSSITPMLAKYAGLYLQSNDTSLMAVTRNFGVDPCDTCDIWLDSHLPDSCTQQIDVTFDNGVTWTTLDGPVSGLPSGNLVEFELIDANVNNITYRYHWTVTLGGTDTFTVMRTKITGNTGGGGADARLRNLRFSRLIMIASIS
jgi:hypothetical protein